MLQRLKMRQNSYWVGRTGMPYYDAARVIGVAHLFLSIASAEVKETGIGWQIRGLARPRNKITASEAEQNTEIAQEGSRRIEETLSDAEGQRKSNIDRLQKWQQVAERRWKELDAYFSSPFPTDPFAKEGALSATTTAMMDSALLQGVRGIDPSGYGHFAAQGGTTTTQPKPDVLAAVIGVSFAACIRVEKTGGRGTEEAMYVLPVVGDPRTNASTDWQPFVAASFREFGRKTFLHIGGERVATVWAMLDMLNALDRKGLPIQDFAYNFAKSRGPFHSGTLNAHKLCRLWRKGCDDVLSEIQRFLESTSKDRVQKGNIPGLCRALCEFAMHSDVDTLERVVRLKSRAMYDSEKRATTLMQHLNTIKQIRTMMEETMGEESFPDLPYDQCKMVALALALPLPISEDPDQNIPPKGWIGRYIKLEKAGDIKRFHEVVESLLSRRMMAETREPRDEKDRSLLGKLASGVESKEYPMTRLFSKLSSPKKFRAWRAAYLLCVQHEMALLRKYNAKVFSSDEQDTEKDYSDANATS